MGLPRDPLHRLPRILWHKSKSICHSPMKLFAEIFARELPNYRQSIKLETLMTSLHWGNTSCCTTRTAPQMDRILVALSLGRNARPTSERSPVVSRVINRSDAREIAVYLAHLQQYHAPTQPPALDFEPWRIHFEAKIFLFRLLITTSNLMWNHLSSKPLRPPTQFWSISGSQIFLPSTTARLWPDVGPLSSSHSIHHIHRSAILYLCREQIVALIFRLKHRL